MFSRSGAIRCDLSPIDRRARQLENRPRIEDPAADAIYVPLTLVPVGASPEDIGARAAAIALLGPAAREPAPLDAAADTP